MMEIIPDKEIFRKVLQTPIVAKWFDYKEIFTAKHDQDCSEKVYADFEHFDLATPEIEKLGQITEISISVVKEMGFTIFFYNGWERFEQPIRYGVFVPCRSEQNGYYSSNLDLEIRLDWTTETIDISEIALKIYS